MLAYDTVEPYYTLMHDPHTREPIFCDNCPMRGEVLQTLDATFAMNLDGTSRLRNYKTDLGSWAVITDIDRNTSEPIRIPALSDDQKKAEVILARADEHIRDEIALCQGPDTKPGVIRRKKQHIVGCHALKGLSLEENLPPAVDIEKASRFLKKEAILDTFSTQKPDLDTELEQLL